MVLLIGFMTVGAVVEIVFIIQHKLLGICGNSLVHLCACEATGLTESWLSMSGDYPAVGFL